MVLGAVVSRRSPTRIDVEAVALRGIATPVAAFFTLLGRATAVTAVSCVAFAVAWARHADLHAVGTLIVSQVASQTVVGGAKRVFRRTRPDGWLLRKEPDLSYPSGHATTALVFYADLAILTLRDARLAPGFALPSAAFLAICVVAIPWSRLALGAHYATDVIGGLLFGAGWSCALLAVASALRLA